MTQVMLLVICVNLIYFLEIVPIRNLKSSKHLLFTLPLLWFLHVRLVTRKPVFLSFAFALDLSDQTDTSSVYFFDHRGSQQADTCLQNFPVRQLSADLGFKCLWGVDRHQHSGRLVVDGRRRIHRSLLVYYNQLPMNVNQIEHFIEQREDFIKFGRDFEPIRITQNQTSIAVVERNSQSVHIFDKQSKEQIDEVQNLLRTEGTFRLWNVLVSHPLS